MTVPTGEGGLSAIGPQALAAGGDSLEAIHRGTIIWFGKLPDPLAAMNASRVEK